MIVQPLAIIGSHFDSIAAGNLARPIAVYGRNEITAIFASLKTMQQALRGTVSDVRKGSQEMHTKSITYRFRLPVFDKANASLLPSGENAGAPL